MKRISWSGRTVIVVFVVVLGFFGAIGCSSTAKAPEETQALEVEPVHAFQDLIAEFDELASLSRYRQCVVWVGDLTQIPDQLNVDSLIQLGLRGPIEEATDASRAERLVPIVVSAPTAIQSEGGP